MIEIILREAEISSIITDLEDKITRLKECYGGKDDEMAKDVKRFLIPEREKIIYYLKNKLDT